jgi:hypothetical protein
MKDPSKRMRAWYELWKKKCPCHSHKQASVYTGIANARPERIAISQPPAAMKWLPYDASGDPRLGE